MTILSTSWALKDEGDLDWQTKYTGHDPKLSLPAGFDENLARDFLLSFARFEDRISHFNACPLTEQPNFRLHQYLRHLGKTSGSNTISGTIKRASFNLSLLSHSRGWFLEKYLPDYCVESVSDPKSLVLKHEDITGKRKTRRARKALKRQDDENFENYTTRFFEYCDDCPDISARGFVEYLANTKKVQYVEPWLLFIGQTLEELSEALLIHDGPPDLKTYVKEIEDAYSLSGLQNAVEDIRKRADTCNAVEPMPA